MSKKDKKSKKGPDRDVRPQRGQESNDQRSAGTSSGRSNDARKVSDESNTTGYGSAERNKDVNIGPMKSDLEQLPDEKRGDRGENLTGPGLG